LQEITGFPSGFEQASDLAEAFRTRSDQQQVAAFDRAGEIRDRDFVTT
jgi:hypothetical protein